MFWGLDLLRIQGINMTRRMGLFAVLSAGYRD
jgi:hypothetical protein